jgi:NAD(P)-dependent dehydrogenase (short-subunit alcohol dehydrogenase family)
MPTALVIGGTSGVGLAVAQQLANRGDAVHIAGRNPDRLAQAMSVSPADVQGHVIDAADQSAVNALAASIGPIQRLVITLAGRGGAGTFAELSTESLRQAFDEKFWPTIAALQACLPHLSQDSSATLVGAITARAAMPGTAGIGSLNAAVEGLVQPLAAELAPIRINAVSPGYIDTPWWAGFSVEERTEFFKQAAATLPIRRIATAHDIAEAVVLLATNPNITGAVIETDGGARLTA